MNNFILYLFESGVSLALLYIVYWIFLKKDTYFNRNRLYLALSILVSLVIPLINIQLKAGTSSIAFFVQLEEVLITPGISQSITSMLLTKSVSLLLVIYLLGVSFFSGILIFRFYQIWDWIKKGESTKIGNIKIIKIQQNISPFSFFNWVFLPSDYKDELEKDEIIDHEKIHIRQLHTFDLLVSELLIVFQWFNPIVWLYRFSFKEIHEYTADSHVLQKGIQIEKYQNLIMNQIFGIQFFPVGNNFNKSLIKKRIIMMTKSKSTRIANLKLLLTVPVLVALVFVFSCSSNSDDLADPIPETEVQAVEGDISEAEVTDEVFFVVEEMPEFQGDNTGAKFRQYIGNNLKYPDIAIENGISGKVFIEFVIDKDGSMTNIAIKRGVDPILDKEAIRVIKSSPNWKPGKQRGQNVRVQYTFPINFALN